LSVVLISLYIWWGKGRKKPTSCTREHSTVNKHQLLKENIKVFRNFFS